MKNKIVGIGFFTIIFTLSCTSSLPLILDENIGSPPLTLSVVSIPESISSEGTEILINYTWNGNKSKFEEKQDAVGGITYCVIDGKFRDGRPISEGRTNYGDLNEPGLFKYFPASPLDEGYVTGEGTLIYSVECLYKDKDGNNHKGIVSNYLEIHVVFTK